MDEKIERKQEKIVCYDISCGGCVTANDEVELTNYLMHFPSKNYLIMEMDVEDEMSERGDGGDSGDCGDDAR